MRRFESKHLESQTLQTTSLTSLAFANLWAAQTFFTITASSSFFLFPFPGLLAVFLKTFSMPLFKAQASFQSLSVEPVLCWVPPEEPSQPQEGLSPLCVAIPTPLLPGLTTQIFSPYPLGASRAFWSLASYIVPLGCSSLQFLAVVPACPGDPPQPFPH